MPNDEWLGPSLYTPSLLVEALVGKDPSNLVPSGGEREQPRFDRRRRAVEQPEQGDRREPTVAAPLHRPVELSRLQTGFSPPSLVFNTSTSASNPPVVLTAVASFS